MGELVSQIYVKIKKQKLVATGGHILLDRGTQIIILYFL